MKGNIYYEKTNNFKRSDHGGMRIDFGWMRHWSG